MRMIMLVLLLCSTLRAHAQGAAPKREFRGVWVATVANIDYPAKPGVNTIALKEQWRQLLALYKSAGLNAVIVQVRPAGDAIYPSSLVPWSRFLTGKQGLGPEDPDFDPLAFMIAETHASGMEFHAWFNPYRATTDLDTASLAPGHIFYRNRDWIIRYGSRLYFNPALPAVRAHITDVVGEVVDRYPIDAVHIDDYFYPYKIQGEVFPDSLDFSKFGRAYASIHDWRRSNVDALIERLSNRIKQSKPHVQFGVSPFGVWRNQAQDPLRGSATKAGMTCYDDLYADILKWTSQGWVDYVVPQLYWHIGFELADFKTLLQWWEQNHHGRLLYVGHGAYKAGTNAEPAWQRPTEIPTQLGLVRQAESVRGSVYFSSKSLVNNTLGVRDSIRQQYHSPALLPLAPYATQLKAHHPPRLTRPKVKDSMPFIRWRPSLKDMKSPPRYYVIYRFAGTGTGDFDDARNIVGVSAWSSAAKTFKFVDQSALPDNTYTYCVVAVNGAHAESQPSMAKTYYAARYRVFRKGYP
jgi:uncharacterized lipoprotein YddW (UPF0748 family)